MPRTRRLRRTHCAKCGVELTAENANPRSDSRGFRSDCKACRAVRRRQLHDETGALRRTMVTRQFCDICKQPERATRNGLVKLLATDHDHTTGAWRGVLCQRCNQAIGLFRDNPQLLRLAADYIENPPGLLILE
jgi:hypothetical protein